MYPNIKAELSRKNMTIIDLSAATGISYQKLTLKLRGESPLKFNEALQIKKALGVDIPLEILFEKMETV